MKRLIQQVLLGLILVGPTIAFAVDVATIPGSFDVGQSGSAQYSIPLKLPPGAAGTQPKITLLYDSQAIGGALGSGWSLGGFSVISRGPKTLWQDGVAKGVVLDDSDALYLDGQRLIPVSSEGSGATKRTQYRKEIDSIDLVTQIGTNLSSATFEVRTKGGTRLYFDGIDGSRVTLSDGTVLLLAVSRIEDSAGNYIRFVYGSNGVGDYVLKSVRYTGHRTYQNGLVVADLKPFAAVDFEYESNISPQIAYISGREVRKEYRLKSAVARVSSTREDANTQWITSAKYGFEYELRPTLGRFVLTRVTQFGENSTNTLQPSTFEYSKAATGWTPSPYGLPAFAIAAPERLSAAYQIGSFAPGTPTILFSALIDGKHESFAFQRSSTGEWEKQQSWAPPFPFAAADGADLGAIALDIDGDGRLDLLQAYAPATGPTIRRSFLAGPSGWIEKPEFALPFDIVAAGKRDGTIISARFSGGSGPDILYQSPRGSGLLINTAVGWKSSSQHVPPLPLGPGARAIDVDCDGQPELLLPSTVSGKTTWRVYRFQTDSWKELPTSESQFIPPIPPQAEPDAVLTARISDRACAALLVSSGMVGARLALQPSAKSGWLSQPQHAPSFPIVDAKGVKTDAIATDLNGDGRDDVVAAYKDSNGVIQRFAFLQQKGGWTAEGKNFLPDTLVSTADRSSQFVDLDVDGQLDLVIPSNGRSGVSAFYTGTDQGFLPRPQFVPTLTLAAASRQDRGIRFVDLNGDGLTDVVFRRDEVEGTEVAGAIGAFLNTANGWVAAPGLNPPRALVSPSISGDPVQFVDVDGDGFVDFLYSYRKRDGTVIRELFKNEPNGTGGRKWVIQPNSALVPPSDIVFAEEGVGDLGVRFVDLNGDGRIDIVASQLKSKDSFQSSASIEICDTSNPPKCELDRTRFVSVAYLNSGSSWVRSDAFKLPLPIVSRGERSLDPTDSLGVELVDVNGDRLVDLVARFKHPHDRSKEISEIWLNTGSEWSMSGLEAPTLLDEARQNAKAAIAWLDINGDGLADLLLLHREGAQNSSRVWLSTGRGFVTAAQWVPPLEVLADRANDANYRFVDLNGDGLLDIVYSRKPDEATVVRGAFLNTGSAWIPAAASDVARVPPLVDQNGNDLGVRLVDVNGDGLLDVVRSYAGGPSGAVVEQQAWLNTGRRSDILVRVDAGNGLVTRVYYQSLAEPALSVGSDEPPLPRRWSKVYERGNEAVVYPMSAPTPASYVVRRVVNELGSRAISLSSSFRYGGYRFDLERLRSLGFAWRERHNEAASTLTRTEFSQEGVLAGKPLREATCLLNALPTDSTAARDNWCPSASDKAAILLTETLSKWLTQSTKVDGRSVHQVSLAEAETATWELDRRLVSRERTKLTYDEPPGLLDRRQNVLRTEISREDGSAMVTINEYAQDDDALWHLGRLTSVSVTKSGRRPATPGSPAPKETRISAFSYDAVTGLLLTEVSDSIDSDAQPGEDPAARAVTKAFGRDQFGNITSITTTAAGLRRRSETVFDALGRFPTEKRIVTAARTFRTTIATAPSTGLPTKTFDEDNLRPATINYDEFGRVRSMVSAGVSTEKAYLSVLDAPGGVAHRDIGGAFAVRTRVGNLPPSFEIFDARGKLVRTISSAFSLDDNKRRLVYVDRRYDALGRQTGVSLPYEGKEPARWILTSFDPLGRILMVQYPSGARVRSEYSGRDGGGRVVVGSDELNNKTTNVMDARGRLEASIDAAGNSVQYEYDAADRVIRVRSPKGSTQIYYKYGQRTRVVDSNLGAWSYEYDLFGQLIRQIDGRGVATSIAYDELGRVRSKLSSTKALSWTYDAAPYGIGQIASISEAGKIERSFGYDRHGNLISDSTVIGTESFVTSYSRDSLGRIEEIAYPQDASGLPVRIKNVYDANGYVKRITDSSGTNVYWQALEADADGKISREVLGNGDQVYRTYDQNTRRLLRSKSVSESGNLILDLTLSFDDHGNLKRRRETTQNVDERFNFDGLNRIIEVEGSPSMAEKFEYDSAGRLKLRTSVGTYGYSDTVDVAQWQPSHAILRTRKAGSTSEYEYDLNGNLISAPFGKLVYDSANRLEQISSGPRAVSLDYDPLGQRYRQSSIQPGLVAETLYIGLFERRVISAASEGGARRFEFRYPVVAPTGVVAMIESAGIAVAGAEQPTTKLSTQVYYLHKDQLGSVVRVTDTKGKIQAQFWFSPFGSRIVGSAAVGFAQQWRRGFTGHEAIEQFGLVHMGGRVYSPAIGTFISPDAVGGDLSSVQSLNLYAYALNNPLFYIDPSGYFNLGGAIVGGVVGFITGGPGGAVVGALVGGNDDSRRWVEQNWREVAVTAVAIGVTVATAGTASPILAGMIVGASTSATSAILYGGSIEEVLAATCRGAVIGAFSGAAYDVVGTAFVGSENSFGAVLAHGSVGGTIGVVQGDNFWNGFAAAALTKSTSRFEFSSTALNVTRAAVVGGTIAEINGGKFANGAIQGVYSYGLNDLAHRARWIMMGATVGGGAMMAGSLALDAATGGLNVLATPAQVAFGTAAGGTIGGFLYDIVYTEGYPPFKGTPGSISWGNGQGRRYGSDGYPEVDVDTGHKHHGHPTPHAHDWGRPPDGGPPRGGKDGDRGAARPTKEGDPVPGK